MVLSDLDTRFSIWTAIFVYRLKKKGGNEKQVEELENNILKRKAQLYEIEQTLPKPNGIYLKIILGNVNVSILNKEEK